jgi:hypothetical protein
MKLEGAQFEISVDGKPRSLRDVSEVAFEAAQFLKGQNPKSDITVRDLRTNISTSVAWTPDK